jgi:hypothetical protein
MFTPFTFSNPPFLWNVGQKMQQKGGFCYIVIGGTHEDNNRRGSNKRAGCNS